MMTQTHVLIAGFVVERVGRAQTRVRAAAVLLGALVPDLPLLLLTIWYVSLRRPAGGDWFGVAYDRYFFHEPLWIVSHNIFHAPLILAVLFAVGHAARDRRLGDALRWFAGSAAGHTLIDVFTHREDGPLLLFPFDWSFRVQAPVSYWDPRYGGDVFFPLELGLDILIIAYLAAVLWRRERRRSGPGGP